MGRNANALVNIGIQRYDRLREQEQFYIDKTDFIREWWENGSDVTLITRPRRFGLTARLPPGPPFFFCIFKPPVSSARYSPSLRKTALTVRKVSLQSNSQLCSRM